MAQHAIRDDPRRDRVYTTPVIGPANTKRGTTNVVQFATTLYPVANWQPLTNIVGNGRLRTIADSAATNSVRFYRVTFE